MGWLVALLVTLPAGTRLRPSALICGGNDLGLDAFAIAAAALTAVAASAFDATFFAFSAAKPVRTDGDGVREEERDDDNEVEGDIERESCRAGGATSDTLSAAIQ